MPVAIRTVLLAWPGYAFSTTIAAKKDCFAVCWAY